MSHEKAVKQAKERFLQQRMWSRSNRAWKATLDAQAMPDNKDLHWEAVAQHYGACIAAEEAGDDTKRDEHHAQKLLHLKAWREATE